MRFHCIATLEFSAEISNLRTVLETLLKEANENILVRGVSRERLSEAAAVKKWEIEGNKLRVELECGRLVRPHHALLRLRKWLDTRLGKAHRIGIRSVVVDELSVSGVELTRPALWEPRIHWFVKSIKLRDTSADIEFDAPQLTQAALEANVVDRVITLLIEKIEAQYMEGKLERREILWSSEQKPCFCAEDPAALLEKAHLIKRTRGKGQWVYGPWATALMNTFKHLVSENVFKPLGFEEMIFPKFEPWHIVKRSGYARSVYSDAYFVAVPRESDPVAWEREMDYFKLLGEVYEKGVMEKIVPVGILSYAQCPPFWAMLENSTIVNDCLPLKFFDWSGPTFRNEAGGTQGIARLEEFHRIETLFVGTPAQVSELWLALVDKTTILFDKVLELEFRKCKVTPWWMLHERSIAELRRGDIGTIDFEAYLPYRGREGEWLEVQNYSSLGDKYTNAFSVRAQRGELWSGDGGCSLERYVCAFLAQKGLEPKNWPPLVRDTFERFAPKQSIKFA